MKMKDQNFLTHSLHEIEIFVKLFLHEFSIFASTVLHENEDFCSNIKISHVAVYLGQYYLDSGDTGYYQLENDAEEHENTKEGRSDGVKISPFRAGDGLVHVARIM